MGGREGNLVALNARNGKELWRRQMGAPMIMDPISYSVSGKQYFAINSGLALYVFGLPEEIPSETIHSSSKAAGYLRTNHRLRRDSEFFHQSWSRLDRLLLISPAVRQSLKGKGGCFSCHRVADQALIWT